MKLSATNDKTLKEKMLERCEKIGLNYIRHEKKLFNGKIKWVVTYECSIHGKKETSWDSMRVIKGCRDCSLKKGRSNEEKERYLKQAKEIVEQKEGLLISTEYRSAIKKLKVLCKYGHEFEISSNSLKNGIWCKKCSMHKYEIGDLRDYAKSKGGDCLSNSYDGYKSQYVWKCSEGHIWESSFYSVKNFNFWCQECRKDKYKISWSNIEESVTKHNGVLLETKKEITFKTHIKLRCKHGHIFTRSVRDLIYTDDRWCAECNKEKRKLEEFNKTLEYSNQRGCFLLSEPHQYITHEEKLLWLCPNKHIWLCTPSNFKRDRSCPECLMQTKRISIEEIEKLASNRNGKFKKDQEYIHSKQLLKWECSKGHEFQISLDSAKGGTWCPSCTSRWINESKCKYIIEQLTGKAFVKTRTTLGDYSDFNTYLELDMYNDELKLALEYNGEQHYKFIEHFHKTEEEFRELQARDMLKMEECIKQNINLITVKYDIDKDVDKIDYIKRELIKYGYDVINENIDMKGYY